MMKKTVQIHLLKKGAFLTIGAGNVSQRWSVNDAELIELHRIISELLPELRARAEPPKPGLDMHGFQSERE